MMRRILSLLLCLSLLSALPALGAEPERWTQETGSGAFCTVRIPYDNGGQAVNWPLSNRLLARYGDTGEIIPLSAYYDGAVFATVPKASAARPLQAFEAQSKPFQDLVVVWKGTAYYNPPSGTDDMAMRGVVRGDGAGRLLPDGIITRAEAVTLLVRTLGLTDVPGESGYRDVAAEAWYAPAVRAARAFGILTPGALFCPERPVTREELTAMTYRAFAGVGLMRTGDGTPIADYGDGGLISPYAAAAYAALEPAGLLLVTRDIAEGTDGLDSDVVTLEPQRPVTRGEAVGYLYSAVRFLPVYPSRLALEYGFAEGMPELDGSTSTYPYTSAVYGALFHNYENHPQFPRSHSKSYESYERLIGRETDALFAATKPSAAQEAQAKAAGVTLEYIPIAYDAMVFFTNAENPVGGLTLEQLRTIYTENAYTSWGQLGGPEAGLLPYCRNTDSGSHALMEQLVLKGGSLHPDLLSGNVSQAMSTALTDVAAALRTDPPAYAIGYSVYYYYLVAEGMMGDVTGNQLKLLEVEGVFPTDESIANGSYPLAGYNYLVLRSDTAADAPARRLAEFMLGKAGQTCVVAAGFGPVRP